MSNVNNDAGEHNEFNAGRDLYFGNIIQQLPTLERRLKLPDPVTNFVGRETELVQARDALRAGQIAVVHGIGGVGKSELSLVVAQSLRADCPEQIMLRANGATQPRSVEDLAREIIVQFEPTLKLPDERNQLLAVYRTLLSGKHLLLILDDVADMATVRALQPPAPVRLMVTSRSHLQPDGKAWVHELHALSNEQSHGLLTSIAPRLSDDTNTLQLLTFCHNLPLAVTVLANTLNSRPDLTTSSYLERLSDERRRMTAFKDSERDVYAILGSSDALLAEADPRLAERWRMLHVCPAPFDKFVIQAIWDEPDEDALDDAIGVLLTRGLLHYDDNRYRVHDLLRDIGRTRCPTDQAQYAHQRHASYFQQVAKKADDLYKKGSENIATALAVFDANWKHIEAGQAWAVQHDDKLTLNYALAFPNILNLRQTPRQQIIWLKAALQAAQRLGDRRDEGAALGNLGLVYAALGEVRTAIDYYEQHVTIAREIGDRRGEGAALGNLGLAYAALGEVRTAIGYYEQHLVIAREIGNRRGEGNAVGNLGSAYADLGEVRTAIGYYEQRLVIAREIGDRRGEGAALGNLGIAYLSLGEVRTAIGYYEQHLVIAREIGDRRGEGNALGNLGSAYADLGEVRTAIGYYEQHLVIAREIGDRRGEGNALGNLGLAYADLGAVRTAIDYYEQQLVIVRDIGDRHGEGNAVGNLGNAYLSLGEIEQALSYYLQSSAIKLAIGDRAGAVLTSWNVGVIHYQRNEYVQAVACFQPYVAYLRELGHPNAEKYAAAVEEVRAMVE